MTRQKKEDFLRMAADLLIRADETRSEDHLMTPEGRVEFGHWVEDLIDNYCEEREQGKCPWYAS